ncbi:glutaredoxin family protein [Gracilibacillus oryzae]|uniref:Glutaredoxin family protein n=1 Tax=Gracilibacillus oryzae TaxID=1672701 RepID=A0A7C8GS36_9BACI|nr:glutaredoxin family protein [Gracilibacillus oryzae]KAB8128988.1 glutaredoxin family protein [Gracilibacillus oryzae]
MEKEVIIYTTTLCPVCTMVKTFLTNLNIPYKEVNIDFNPLAMVKLVSKTLRLTVPQTSINGEWVFGFNPALMLEKWNA